MIAPLVILAATMGNRYGGLKYLDGIGPHGETILDYSVYDAIQAGFKRIIFVINPSFEKAFKETISSKYKSVVDVDYVYQDVTDVPEAWRNPKRTALWGSAHALLRGRSLLEGGPFAVINAVNFYQRETSNCFIMVCSRWKVPPMTHSLSVTNWQMSCRNREEPTGESVSSTMTGICCMWTNWPVWSGSEDIPCTRMPETCGSIWMSRHVCP